MGPASNQQAFVNDRRQDFAILAETGIPTVRLPSEDVAEAVILRLGELLETRAAHGPRSNDPA